MMTFVLKTVYIIYEEWIQNKLSQDYHTKNSRFSYLCDIYLRDLIVPYTKRRTIFIIFCVCVANTISNYEVSLFRFSLNNSNHILFLTKKHCDTKFSMEY